MFDRRADWTKARNRAVKNPANRVRYLPWAEAATDEFVELKREDPELRPKGDVLQVAPRLSERRPQFPDAIRFIDE